MGDNVHSTNKVGQALKTVMGIVVLYRPLDIETALVAKWEKINITYAILVSETDKYGKTQFVCPENDLARKELSNTLASS